MFQKLGLITLSVLSLHTGYNRVPIRHAATYDCSLLSCWKEDKEHFAVNRYNIVVPACPIEKHKDATCIAACGHTWADDSFDAYFAAVTADNANYKTYIDTSNSLCAEYLAGTLDFYTCGNAVCNAWSIYGGKHYQLDQELNSSYAQFNAQLNTCMNSCPCVYN